MSAQEHLRFEPTEQSGEIIDFPKVEVRFRDLPHKEQLQLIGSATVEMAKAAFFSDVSY